MSLLYTLNLVPAFNWFSWFSAFISLTVVTIHYKFINLVHITAVTNKLVSSTRFEFFWTTLSNSTHVLILFQMTIALRFFSVTFFYTIPLFLVLMTSICAIYTVVLYSSTIYVFYIYTFSNIYVCLIVESI